MNLEIIKEKCKNCKRKDSIKNILNHEELDFIKEHYNHELDFSCFLLLQELKGIYFALNCSCCNNKLSETQIKSNIKHRTGFYCSKKCNPNYQNIDYQKRQEKIEETNIKKYGTKNVSDIPEVKEKISNRVKESSTVALEKRKETNLQKYGVSHIMQLQETKDKLKNTSINNFGVSHPMKSKSVKDKLKKTNLENFGYEWSFQNPEIKEKIKNTHLEIRGVEYPSQDPAVWKKISDTFESKYGVKNIGMSPVYREKAYQTMMRNGTYRQQVSLIEIEIANFIKSLGVEINQSVWDIIPPKQLDIFIPKFNLAIEVNGIYWHSNLFKDKNYHLEKTEDCEKQGIQLLHIFDSEWRNKKKQEIWKSVIKNKLGLSEKIPARKCIKKEISSKEAFDFCENNHLQGGIHSKKAVGLFYNNELVQVATFGTPRYNKKYKWELLRLCSKNGVVVQGGSSKLLKDFSDIISYANRRWSMGNVYNQIGFKQIGITKPNYFYIINGNLESRIKYQKKNLSSLLEKFDDTKTEQENMKMNGIYCIYDSGNIVYIKQSE